MEKIGFGKDLKNITVQEGFDKFIRLKQISNLSPATIKFYKNGFRYFGEFFNVSRFCTDITKDVFYDYIEHLQKNKNANSITINTYLRSVRAIIYFFIEEGYTQYFKVKLLKVEKHVKETYSEQELEKLLKKPNLKKCDFIEYRSWVLANYLLATGNRISTAINIKNGHLDFENKFILLGKTKNGKQQLIPMSNNLADVLREYLIYRKGEAEDYVFCSVHGEQLTRDGTISVLRRYHLRRGVDKTSAHIYRHTFAKWWILNGGDIFRLQKILGHNSLDMVRNYVEMFNDDLKRNFDSFNPLDNFTKGQHKERIKLK